MGDANPFQRDRHRLQRINTSEHMITLPDAKAHSGGSLADTGPLYEGDVVPGGQYQIVKLLYQRPRLHLYLGRSIASTPAYTEQKPEPLFAIRELVLNGLSSHLCAQIVAAAFEEFISPLVLGVPHFPVAEGRVWCAEGRHYLVMPLRAANYAQDEPAITLEDLCLEQRQWPAWLNREIALFWGGDLCRTVAHLHRLGVVLGELNPATILVSHLGMESWAPIVLLFWPPAPHFWMASLSDRPVQELYAEIFPVAEAEARNVFIAPEMLHGVCDERADVYSLGALLYLLLTHHAPVATLRRLYASQRMLADGESVEQVITEQDLEALELVPPRQLCPAMSMALEGVILRAIDPDPDLRYASVAELSEELEVATKLELASEADKRYRR